MSFDAWIVAFGLSRVLIELKLITSPQAYSVLLATLIIDAYLLYQFFTKRKYTDHMLHSALDRPNTSHQNGNGEPVLPVQSWTVKARETTEAQQIKPKN